MTLAAADQAQKEEEKGELMAALRVARTHSVSTEHMLFAATKKKFINQEMAAKAHQHRQEAARKIQATVRGKKGRSDASKKKLHVAEMNNFYTFLESAASTELENAAIKLQSATRGKQSRVVVAAMQTKQFESMTSKIAAERDPEEGSRKGSIVVMQDGG